jgi:hypothetical protein
MPRERLSRLSQRLEDGEGQREYRDSDDAALHAVQKKRHRYCGGNNRSGGSYGFMKRATKQREEKLCDQNHEREIDDQDGIGDPRCLTNKHERRRHDRHDDTMICQNG